MSYKAIDLTSFLVAGVIISIPAVYLDETGNKSAAGAYVGLILLSLLVFYYPQVETFANELRGA